MQVSIKHLGSRSPEGKNTRAFIQEIQLHVYIYYINTQILCICVCTRAHVSVCICVIPKISGTGRRSATLL